MFLDGFGRVFYPNAGQFRMEMVDTSNNYIGHCGKYGNKDSPSTSSRGAERCGTRQKRRFP